MPFEKLPNKEQRNIELRELESEEKHLQEKIKTEMLRLFAVRYDLIRGGYDKLQTRDVEGAATLTEGYTTSAIELDDEARQELRGESPNVSYYLKTSAGGPRSKYNRNEDSFFLDIKQKFGAGDSDEETMAVFDGVGGAGQGVLASRIAVAAGLRHMAYGGYKNLEEIAPEISRDIRHYALGGAVTGVIVHFEDNAKKFGQQIGGGRYKRYISIMAAGDTKALTIRNGAVFQEGTTALQNIAFELDKGAGNYYTAPNLNVITNCFGGDKPIRAQVIGFKPEANDVVVVATDALWDNISEYEILELLKSAGPKFEEELYNLAYQRNNAEDLFQIKHSPEKTLEKKLRAGDNLTLGIMRVRA